MGFDHATDDKATFDEFYLVEYVYGSFQKGGTDMMNEAHLLSHFDHVNLSAPISRSFLFMQTIAFVIFAFQ